jgi:hypothetical protein
MPTSPKKPSLAIPEQDEKRLKNVSDAFAKARIEMEKYAKEIGIVVKGSNELNDNLKNVEAKTRAINNAFHQGGWDKIFTSTSRWFTAAANDSKTLLETIVKIGKAKLETAKGAEQFTQMAPTKYMGQMVNELQSTFKSIKFTQAQSSLNKFDATVEAITKNLEKRRGPQDDLAKGMASAADKVQKVATILGKSYEDLLAMRTEDVGKLLQHTKGIGGVKGYQAKYSEFGDAKTYITELSREVAQLKAVIGGGSLGKAISEQTQMGAGSQSAGVHTQMGAPANLVPPSAGGPLVAPPSAGGPFLTPTIDPLLFLSRPPRSKQFIFPPPPSPLPSHAPLITRFMGEGTKSEIGGMINAYAHAQAEPSPYLQESRRALTTPSESDVFRSAGGETPMQSITRARIRGGYVEAMPNYYTSKTGNLQRQIVGTVMNPPVYDEEGIDISRGPTRREKRREYWERGGISGGISRGFRDKVQTPFKGAFSMLGGELETPTPFSTFMGGIGRYAKSNVFLKGALGSAFAGREGKVAEKAEGFAKSGEGGWGLGGLLGKAAGAVVGGRHGLMQGAVGGLQTVGKGALDFGKALFGLNAIGSVLGKFSPMMVVFEPLGEVIGAIGEMIGTSFLPLLQDLLKLIFSPESMAMIQGLMEALKPIAVAVGSLFASLADSGIFKTFTNAFQTIFGLIAKIFESESVKTAIAEICKALGVVIDNVVTVLVQLLPVLMPFLILFVTLIAKLMPVITGLVAFLAPFIAKILGGVLKVIQGILNGFITAINWFIADPEKKIKPMTFADNISLQKQGVVYGSGWAKVHTGEMVVKRELIREVFGAMSVTNNFYGNVDEVQRMEFEHSMVSLYERRRRM